MASTTELTSIPVDIIFRIGERDFAINPKFNAYNQACAMQKVAISVINNPLCPADLLPALMRAWDVLEERKRILRGDPLPGSLRPDLDPVQLARANKRARQRQSIDVPQVAELPPAEADAAPAEAPIAQEKKEIP